MVEKDSNGVSRRKVLTTTGGIAGAGIVSGCLNTGGNDDGSGNGSSSNGNDEMNGNGEMSNERGSDSMDTSPLNAGGSSTVYPIANSAARLWNGNPPASDEEYWGPGQYGIDTDMNLADYFGSFYGFEPTDERTVPPFTASVALSHSGTGVEAVINGRADFGNASSTAESILGPDNDALDSIVDHVVGVDGQPLVVSREIYDAGVTSITGEELRDIYMQEITNWSELGGPDREIYAVGRAEDSGTDTAFRTNLYGDPDAPIEPDVRRGQNQQVASIIEQEDNAIAYIALAFVEPDGATPAVDLELDGTTYSYGENLGAEDYPLNRDLHMYTWGDTSMKEAAFLNMILSDFGQQEFVASNNYFTLPDDRRQEERDKLPNQV
ncbi:substrate-binding domain-containing protein [Haladaptatus sp. F3-133]|uniref:Substrate-binding domain-containing protein n=1 Tax=Halorutilus salinus TaxID=2487751 RepID=A0A9Q4GI58_9EURY|nr:substrate-binding domain-containing protein [Halorutilus salinus]MCX2817986.1 substrate-binding domain-containing protein [Halorutilus salinus]